MQAADLAARIRERIPEAVTDARTDLGCPVLVVRADDLLATLELLRDELSFELLSDLSATDWLPREPRFDVNYHLTRMATNERIRVKVQLPDDDPTIPSAIGVYPTADWHEREVYDFFGITFRGHPDLKRIFMPDEWIGYPLRKDYPVGGVPVEYKIEPAYVGDRVVSEESRPAAGGVPGRLARDRGKPSRWTWTGPPASGVRVQDEPEPPHPETDTGEQEGP